MESLNFNRENQKINDSQNPAEAVNDKRLFIFDMDGTLIDSMSVWKKIDDTYLNAHDVKRPDNFSEAIASLTLPECADYFIKLGIKKDKEKILDEIMAMAYDEYSRNVKLKPGMLDLLKNLSGRGTICLLTSSERPYAVPVLKRLGVFGYFDKIYTSGELHMDKRTPEIYRKVCALCGAPAQNATVYEDAPFAIRSAKKAGCRVVAVYDKSAGTHWKEIEEMADEVFMPS